MGGTRSPERQAHATARGSSHQKSTRCRQQTRASVRSSTAKQGRRTTAISLPALFLNALVHFTLRGFLFLMNALWHLGRQNRKDCATR